MGFVVNWPVRSAILALTLVLVSLPWKFVVERAPVDMIAEGRHKSEALKQFVLAHGAQRVSRADANSAEPNWIGWRFDYGQCRVVAFPNFSGNDSVEMLHRHMSGGAKLIFVYQGRYFGQYPTYPVGVQQVTDRLTWAFGPARWRIPMVTILFLTGDCDPLRQWDWSAYGG